MPLTALAIGSIAAPVVGGLIGQQSAQSQLDAANNARQQALQQYAGINTPTIQEQQLALQQYQNTGQLSPVLEQALGINSNALAGISNDPRLQASQMAALQGLAGYASGQPTAADMAGFQLAQNQSAAQEQAQQNAILQQMQQRGMAGSGAELLAKLQGSQNATQNLQNAQLQQAQAMQQAKLQALAQQGGMASNIIGQQYGQAANAAQAQNAINQFNVQNAQQVGNQNVALQNQAQQYNLQKAQDLANLNTNIANQQQQYNKGLYQQQFNNQMGLASGKAGQYQGIAGAAQQQAANNAGMWGQVGQGVGTGLAAYANASKPTTNGTTTTNNYYSSTPSDEVV